MNTIDSIRMIERDIADINRRLTNIRFQAHGHFTLEGLDDVNLSTPIRHDFLMYDAAALKWINYNLDLDFEDSIDYAVTDIWQALVALIRLEDTLAGNTLTIEDSI